MTVICFTGSDQKGQDALVEVLIRLLSDAGRAVSVIVHANEDDPLDTPGKDTHAHAEAGARAVLAISDARWALFSREDKPPTLQELVRRTQPGNVVLALGFDEAPYPTFVIDDNGISVRRSPEVRIPRFDLDNPGPIIKFILRLNNPDR